MLIVNSVIESLRDVDIPITDVYTSTILGRDHVINVNDRVQVNVSCYGGLACCVRELASGAHHALPFRSTMDELVRDVVLALSCDKQEDSR